MKKIILFGKSGCGKTTLTQALNGDKVGYQKTQYVNYYDAIIDTPGEYMQTRELGSALAVYACEADVVGFIISATEDYSLLNPNVASICNREVIGIVTQIDKPDANIAQARNWLQLAGCEVIFEVNSVTGEGVKDILDYLNASIKTEQ